VEGRHVVVTGAGRGIGKAIALRLAREGARLSLLARGVDALSATASEIGGPNDAGDGDRFFDLVETNLVGTYRCIRAAQLQLAPGPDRRDIVVISSILARIGVPGYTGYCASKAGLLGLVQSASPGRKRTPKPWARCHCAG
jgi:NAD(P)-dependent dehydrogenase (short-subunit alcohol dehydrogenase family)